MIVTVASVRNQAMELKIFFCSSDFNSGTNLDLLLAAIITYHTHQRRRSLATTNFVIGEVPAGNHRRHKRNLYAKDANTPVAQFGRAQYIEGYHLVQGAGKDYTVTGNTITMAAAPISGENIIANYRK